MSLTVQFWFGFELGVNLMFESNAPPFSTDAGCQNCQLCFEVVAHASFATKFDDVV